MTPQPQYQYSALDDDNIRLLSLEPGRPEEPIKCNLRPASMSGLPEYETVSYCWGDSTTSSHRIQVGGKILPVPQSTAEVLNRFRFGDRPRTLWIDAICIDQRNVHERSSQVAKMHTIYASAVRNLIWLGNDEEGTSAQAIGSMNNLIREIEEETDGFKTFPFSGGGDFYMHAKTSLKQDFNPKPLLQLCSKPWFGRLWIVQEASLARENLCHCGQLSFDLVTLLRVGKWVWTKRAFLDIGNFADAQKILARLLRICDFADKECGWFHRARAAGWFDRKESGTCDQSVTRHMLTVLRTMSCSQPIDHIYGLLGLYREFSGQAELPAILRPDYSKSVEEVLNTATRQALSESQDLATFHDIYHRVENDGTELRLPSWVPQWHQPWNMELDPTPIHRGYMATGQWINDPIPPASDYMEKLHLEGFLVDGELGSRVEVLTERFLEKCMNLEFLNSVEDMVNMHPLVGKDNVEAAISSTLCAEESAEREQASSDDLLGYGDLKSWIEKYKDHPELVILSLKTASTDDMRAARYAEASWRACYRRKFFITAAGRIGLGPQTMQEGDVVVILYGGEWPFVLRPCDGEYELVGPCYVYGIMGGQAVVEHDERGEGEVWFCIR